MKYILNNINVFDKNIGTEFDRLIKDDITLFDKTKVYKVRVNYDVELTYNEELRLFENSIYNDIDNGKNEESRLSEALSKQLREFDRVLDGYGVSSFNLSINGSKIKQGTVEIIIEEDISKKNAETGRGKNKKRIQVSVISPDDEDADRRLNKIINKQVSEGYYRFRKELRSLELFCKVLELPITENEDKLYKLFFMKYEKLFSICSSKEEIEEIRERLTSRVKVLQNEMKSSNRD